MNKLAFALLAFTLLCTATWSEAQTLSKSEKKALKKEIKTYKKDPVKWVKMQNKHKEEVEELREEVADLKAKLAAANAEKQELADKLAALQNQYAALKKSMPSTELPMGTVYQVQMGYYQYLDLVSFNSKLKTVKAEEIDGAKRYVIGHFENVMDALQFSNDVKSLGIKDAFVSQYIDGKRNMEFDALQSISK
jgi:septal ring factor EnvC (AmiA/AmiB activator)